MYWMFLFFFVSGFCSILYEIIWLRLAMAAFGVTTALVSIVLSTFMAGLGLGAWASGQIIRKYGKRLSSSALQVYALIELLIGVSAILVPYELLLGRRALMDLGLSSSSGYYLFSAAWVGFVLIPWCSLMGATIPFAMLAIQNNFSSESKRSFSFLYLANVLGASLGTVLPLALIEILGFRGTLRVGATLNAFLAVTATVIAQKTAPRTARSQEASPGGVSGRAMPASRRALMLLLLGGLTSMGAEVVWVRQFTPYAGTVVYAFAAILGFYLISTFIGSQIYRQWNFGPRPQESLLWLLVGLTAVWPVFAADPRVVWLHGGQGFHTIMGFVRIGVGVAPFSAVLGFVTPMLVDRWSGGIPDRAGNAYAINVLGCIVGPLLAGFVLLPIISERWVLLFLSLPWLLIAMYQSMQKPAAAWRTAVAYGGTALAILLVWATTNFEDQFPSHRTLRDNTATVVAVLGEGRDKQLLVNGRGMTGLTPLTKMMAHFTLASLDHPPKAGLVICFGMGTTYRSMLSWGIRATAVELVPSVPRLFKYYYSDAPALLRSPLARIEIDDGRRFLERTSQPYDVITIDPPPPPQSAGSSLLYSKEFYATVKQRLVPGGILAQWLPAGDEEVQSAVALALEQSFDTVRSFRSIEGGGLHFLASDRVIPHRNASELVQKMPERAVEDMMEWGPYMTPEEQVSSMLNTELSLDQIVAQAPRTPAMQDDLPVNEYFLLRVLRRGTYCRSREISQMCTIARGD